MGVYNALAKEELLSYGDCDFIRSIASYIGRGSLPSPAQCRRLLKIVEKVEEKGYIMLVPLLIKSYPKVKILMNGMNFLMRLLIERDMTETKKALIK